MSGAVLSTLKHCPAFPLPKVCYALADALTSDPAGYGAFLFGLPAASTTYHRFLKP